VESPTVQGTGTQARRALAEALRYAGQGYALTPVTITRGANGKKQARFHKGWRHETSWSSDPDQIRAWWVDYPDTSFALGGAANRVEGVDLDVKPAEGIDAVAWWAAQGLPAGALIQVTPSGGHHMVWRCRSDGEGLPQEAGKTLGRGIDTRNRSGLFFAAGAYIVGEAGHYEVVGDLPHIDALATTPSQVVELFANVERPAERATDGRIVVKDELWQQGKVDEALQAIRDHRKDQGGYRAKIQHVGLFLGRAVEQGFLTAERAEAQWREAHCSVWGPAVWPENVKDFRDALKDGPRLERWRTPDPQAGSTFDTSVVDPETGEVTELSAEEIAARRHAAEVEASLFRKRASREADRLLAAELRDPLEVLDAAAFLDAPQPDYLVPRLLYKDSTAKVFGPPGGTKSFFLLDLALSLATGTEWHGVPMTRARVHFVMAEGQAVNVARALGWLHARGVDRAELNEWFTAIPQGVLLTPEGIEGYRQLVAEHQPALIVLDTKNAMMLGEENSASDVAVMVRAMRTLRDEAGGACVVLVDHTGISDTTRGRGSNAVTAAMDTEVRVERDEGGTATAQVTRDKAAEPGAQWTYRITRVEGVPGLRPGTPTPAVPVPAEQALSVSIHAQDAWWNVPTEQLPEGVQKIGGASGEAARDLFRALLYGAGDDGLTMPEVSKMLRERCPRKHGSDTLGNGRNRLLRDHLIEHGETASGAIADRRYRVAQHVLRTLEPPAELSD